MRPFKALEAIMVLDRLYKALEDPVRLYKASQGLVKTYTASRGLVRRYEAFFRP